VPNTPVFGVVLAFIFLFFILSLVCSSLNESVATLLRWRSKHLKLGLENLLSGTEEITAEGKQAAERLLRHPLIQTLAPPKSRLNKHPIPAYIPASAFMSALLTLDLAPLEGRNEIPKEGGKVPKTAAEVESAIRRIESAPVRDVLLMLFHQAGNKVPEFRQAGERWFDSSMDRVSGWYRRKTQWWLLLWALVVALAVNADSLQIADRLWKDEAVRDAVIARAEQAGTNGGGVNVNDLKIPLGWSLSTGGQERDFPDDTSGWIAKAIGILITTFALLLGAPFWFDLLGKVAHLRAAGVKPAKAEKT
jgi:hypothetical protein